MSNMLHSQTTVGSMNTTTPIIPIHHERARPTQRKLNRKRTAFCQFHAFLKSRHVPHTYSQCRHPSNHLGIHGKHNALHQLPRHTGQAHHAKIPHEPYRQLRHTCLPIHLQTTPSHRTMSTTLVRHASSSTQQHTRHTILDPSPAQQHYRSTHSKKGHEPTKTHHASGHDRRAKPATPIFTAPVVSPLIADTLV